MMGLNMATTTEFMTVENAATLYIITWVLACNWVFFIPKRVTHMFRGICWGLTLPLMLGVTYYLDRHFMGVPHHAWQESTVYVVFIFMSFLFSTIGFLSFKTKS